MASFYIGDTQTDSLNDEPTLDELFAEPIIQLVMKRDGVKAQDMRTEIDRLLEACPA